MSLQRFFAFYAGLCLAAFIFPASAHAQVHVPSTAQPAQVQQRLQIEQERPEVGGEPLITLPEEGGKQVKGGVTFVLEDIEFEHLTVFTKERLLPDYKEFIGQKVDLGTLHTIASRVTVRYRNAGYILSRAIVPPQEIKNGIAKIRIVEAYVNKVMFEGIKADSGLLAAYARKIRAAHPLDAATLERYLLLMQDLPGITARATIRPSPDAPGASDVVITVSEKMIDGSVTADNRGTRFMGPLEGGLTASLNNILGLFDRTTFRGEAAAEFDQMYYGQIVHEEQLDSEGTKLALSAGYTHTHPGYTLGAFDIEGKDQLYTAAISHPFIRSRQDNLIGNIEFDYHDTNVLTLGKDLYDDHLRVLRIGGSYDFIDRFLGVNRMQATFSQGLNWGTESPSPSTLPSRTGGQTDFQKGTAEITRLQPIHGPFDLYVAGTGQMASDPLLIAEQFSLGGANYGSAYDPSELLGDAGLAGRAELRYSRSGDFMWVPSYQFYGFYDIGTVWIRDAATGSPSQSSLADAGLGLRFNASQPLSGNFEFAYPLTRAAAADVGAGGQGDGFHPRAFFSLAYRF